MVNCFNPLICSSNQFSSCASCSIWSNIPSRNASHSIYGTQGIRKIPLVLSPHGYCSGGKAFSDVFLTPSY